MIRSELPWHRRLAFLIIGFLSIALLPIGLISVVQTQRVSQDSRSAAEANLLALTERVALTERSSIEQAAGAADALTGFADLFMADPDSCESYLREYVSRAQRYDFVGVVKTSGETLCSSSGKPDFSKSDGFAKALEKQSASISLEFMGESNTVPTIEFFQPIFVDSSLNGFLVVSQPHLPLRHEDYPGMKRGFVELSTFSLSGEILTFNGDETAIIDQLPPGLKLPDLAADAPRVFSDRNGAGNRRIYTVVPLLAGSVYALGIWNDDAVLTDQDIPVHPATFPVLMWLTSLLVAILAMHRLVVRHVRHLSRSMREFSRNRTIDETLRRQDMPAELAVISDDFRSMALDILRDEAELEDALRSKDVLLKEVHHRVKNNLQLIASIMSIQIRSTKNTDTEAVVRRLQARVLSLATIHQNLYKLQSEGRVNAGQMIDEIVRKSKDLAADMPYPLVFECDLDEVLLFPDQAVPLSLLVTEIINAAIRVHSSQAEAVSVIAISMKLTDAGECELKITNSAGARKSIEEAALGKTLVKAFVTQLGGEMTRAADSRVNLLSLRFHVAEFAYEAENY